MKKRKRQRTLKQAMNPLVTLRAQTITNKKRQAARDACRRGKHGGRFE